MGFYDDVNDAMGRDTGLRSIANVGRQAVGDTSFRSRPQALDPEDAKAYAQQPAAQGGIPSNVAQASEVVDASKRKYSGGLEGPRPELPALDSGVRGVSVTNTYDPDRPASMGAQGNNPWQDMARQLANFSALRNRDQPTPGFNALSDPNDAANDEKTRRWAMDDMVQKMSRAGPRQAAVMKDMALGMANADTQRRGQTLQHDAALSGQGIQARGQDMSMMSHLEGIDRSGANAQTLAGIQGSNQLRNTELQGGIAGRNQEQHDLRASVNQENLESMKQNDPRNQAMAEYYSVGAKDHAARTKLAQDEAAYGKTPHAMLAKDMQLLSKIAEQGGPAGDDAQKRLRALMLKQDIAARRNGLAEGGQVKVTETADQLMARINAKYGVSGNSPTPQQPAPQQPQQAPQQSGGLEHIRSYSSGMGIDQRMKSAGFADGGEVEALRAKLAGFEKAGADYTASFGGGVTTASNVTGGSGPYSDARGFGSPSAPAAPYSLSSVHSSGGYEFANGGPIEVGGRQVLGEGTGKSDSLPAIIDGEHPAALSTDEFVMPVETVRHFGLAKLHKMVEQSRKGLDARR